MNINDDVKINANGVIGKITGINHTQTSFLVKTGSSAKWFKRSEIELAEKKPLLSRNRRESVRDE